jgi:hypothetical protein
MKAPSESMAGVMGYESLWQSSEVSASGFVACSSEYITESGAG